MFDTESELRPPVHFARDDPRLLGETLVMAAQYCFIRGGHHVTYDCNGQWLRFVAGGVPFRVDVTEIKDGERPVFHVENTGDGLTYVFAKDENHTPLTQIIINSAKDHVRRINQHI